MDQGRSGDAYRFGDVELDVRRRRLLRGGAQVPLEPKAYAVLLELLRHAGGVVARDALLDAVWGHRHVTPAVLNRIVAILRRELGDDADHPRWIRTVHGVGYEFIGALEAPADEPAPAADDAPGPIVVAPEAAPARPPARVRWLTFALLVLAVALALYAGWPSWHWPPAAPPADQRSVAVLPLRNVSGDASQQFFADGLSDNLIATLSRFNGLKVIGRISAFRFQDSTDDSRSIGRKLGVTHLLGGSVQREGDTVRISATLTEVDDGSTLWAEHFDRPYKDLFALQDEIAQSVADALHAKLLSARGAASQSDRPPSGDIDAYNAYLQGLQSFYKQDFRQSIAYHQKATQIDPAYAAAWAQLSVAWAHLGQYDGTQDAHEAFRQSREAVDKALDLEPDLGLAHGALGNLLLAADIDWNRAVAEFRRSVQFAPDNGQNHGGLSRALAATGRLSEAIEHRQRFISIEPLVAGNYFLQADLLIAMGRLDEAEKNVRIGLELLPQSSSPMPPFNRLYMAVLRGDAKAALDLAEASQPEVRDFRYALAAQIGSDRVAADAALARVLDHPAHDDRRYAIAQIYALRGDVGKTIEWLERTWAARDPTIHHLLYDPILLQFRDEPQLVAFCRRIGLPSPGDSEALGLDQIRRLRAPSAAAQ